MRRGSLPCPRPDYNGSVDGHASGKGAFRRAGWREAYEFQVELSLTADVGVGAQRRLDTVPHDRHVHGA